MAFNSFNGWWALNGGRCDSIDNVRDLAENAWDAAVEKFTSTNTDYTAAQKTLHEFMSGGGSEIDISDYPVWLHKRLNAWLKPQPQPKP